MICVSLAEVSVDECLRALGGIEFAEIRIDKTDYGVEEVRKVFSRHPRLIATCRPGGREDAERLVLLREAVRSGAAYVDLELESGEAMKHELVREARVRNCRVIISYHNFDETPARVALDRIVGGCFEAGADIGKVACRVRSEREAARLLGLLEADRPLVVIGLGELGKITRIAGPLLGSPFTYASLEPGKETGEGQIERAALEELFRSLENG